MRHIILSTDQGTSWETEINGTDKEIKDYYVNKFFNVGVYPVEKMEMIKKVEFVKKEKSNDTRMF